MSLTYDQRSELRLAFEEAYVPDDRRRACRVKHRVEAKLAPFQGRKAPPIEVTIEDFSTTGVGLIYRQPLKVGAKYLLEVPRPDLRPIWVLLTVARTRPMDDGTFGVGLEASEILDPGNFKTNPFTGENIQTGSCTMRAITKRTKILFLLFGIAGLSVAVFMNI